MSKEFSKVQDSGKREEFPTGAKRDTQEGKGRFDLLPVHAITRLAKHFENGAVKYGDDNWRKGIPLRRYLDSMLRHAFKFAGGADDEDHLAAVIWNACCLLETQELIEQGLLPKELDNLPTSIYAKTETEEEAKLVETFLKCSSDFEKHEMTIPYTNANLNGDDFSNADVTPRHNS